MFAYRLLQAKTKPEFQEVPDPHAGFHPGDAVAVNPSWGSRGRCHMCRSGEENHCLYQKAIRAIQPLPFGR